MCETTAWKDLGNVTSHAATTFGQWVFYVHGNNIEARDFLSGQTTTLSTESWRNVRVLLAVPELGKLVAFGYSGVYSIDPRTRTWDTLIPVDHKKSVVATCYGKHIYYIPTLRGFYGDEMFCLDLESKVSTPVFTNQSWGSTCALVTCLGRIISFHSNEIRSLDPLTGECKQLNNESWGTVVAACELNGFVYCVTSRMQGCYGSIYRVNSLTGQYKCLSNENWGSTTALVGCNDKLYAFTSRSLYEVSFAHPQSHFSVSELPQFLNTAANALKFVPEVICSTDPDTVLVGVGCFGAVFVWNGEREKYAIKMMYNYTNSTRSQSLKQLVQGEVLLHLPCLQHKNIIKLLYAFVHTPRLDFVYHIMATYNALDSSTKLLDITWINPSTKQPNPTQFLVLEYMACGPLDKYRKNLDSVLSVLKVCKQIADVIDHLFQNRIAHRDVKLNNFLVSVENGELVVKLADFGLAIQLNEHSMSITLDADDCVGGAINYLAPEVRYAPVKGNQRTVCYKYQPAFEIGVVFFELAFHTVPFPTQICSPLDDQVFVTQQEFWGSQGLWYPNKFVDLVKRCLSIDGTQRPSTQLIRETMEEILVDVQQTPSLNDTFVLLD